MQIEIADKIAEEARIKAEEEKKRQEEEVIVDDTNFGFDQSQSDVLPKVLVIGQPGIGKTSMIAQIVKQISKPIKAAPTK